MYEPYSYTVHIIHDYTFQLIVVFNLVGADSNVPKPNVPPRSRHESERSSVFEGNPTRNLLKSNSCENENCKHPKTNPR